MFKETLRIAGQILPAIALSVLVALPAAAEKAPDLSARVIRTPPIESTVAVDQLDLKSLALASKILNSDAYMEGGTKIGTVSDIVIDSNNQAAVVVDVGKFLGASKRKVAIPMSEITFEPHNSKIMIIAEVTKTELQHAKAIP
jgi:sporulation protein YlmC with PRC-barrel domain